MGQCATIEPLEPRRLCAAPIVFTKGGTYSGTWQSTDWHTAAVIIATTSPVTIINSTLRGPGNLITNSVDHVNLTIKNCWGYGTNPNLYGVAKGRFIALDHFNNVLIQDNHLESTGGIHLQNYAGFRTASNTVKIIGNKAHNIDGRKSNGNNGYLDFNTRTRISDGHREDGFVYAQFVQLDKIRAVGSMEIAWNRVINDPGVSRVEDNISVFLSSGTATNPIRIHDNYVQGAYTIKPWQGSYSNTTWRYDWSYSGGGINLGDGLGFTVDDPAYVKAYGNTVIDTTNFG